MRFALSRSGGMAEWFKAAVLKTASPKGDVGSNPTPSAMHFQLSTSLSLGGSRSESDKIEEWTNQASRQGEMPERPKGLAC